MRGPFSTPITPLPGSFFHADPQLCAADPAPEVLLTVDGDLWVKGPQGWGVDGEDGDNIAEDFSELLEVLDPGYVEGWWATRADYDAHRAQQAGEGGR